MKRCSRCKLEKPFEMFSKAKKEKSGYASACKMCVKEYYNKNQEKVLKYRESVREKSREYNRNWRKLNKEFVKQYNKNSYDSHQQERIEYAREYRERHPDKVSANNESWRKRNRHKCRTHDNNRRARKNNAGGSHTYAEIICLLKKQKGRCVVCLKNIKNKYHVDHIIPLKLGGGSNIENIQLLCPPCNHSKGPKHPIKFMQERGFLL